MARRLERAFLDGNVEMAQLVIAEFLKDLRHERKRWVRGLGRSVVGEHGLERAQLAAGVSHVWKQEKAVPLYPAHSLVIMLPNDSLHRLGTRHRGLFAHQSSRRAHAPREDLPDGIERRGTHTVLVGHAGEDVEVVALVLPHVLCVCELLCWV